MSLKDYLITMRHKLLNKPLVYNSECKEFVETFDKKVRDIIDKSTTFDSPSHALFTLPIPVSCGPDVEQFLYKEGLKLHGFPGHRVEYAKEIMISFHTAEPFLFYKE
jgi:hypothetical protein